jgi:hypothetical protein
MPICRNLHALATVSPRICMPIISRLAAQLSSAADFAAWCVLIMVIAAAEC